VKDQRNALGGIVPLNVKFRWNDRWCWGTEFHIAALTSVNGSQIKWAERLLQEDETHLTRRFRYLNDDSKLGEGSGEPIHLAASVHDKKMMEWLLEKKANINAFVTRGHSNYYDVLLGAIWAQGKGGEKDFVEYVLNHKSFEKLHKNANGETPLDLAFRAGAYQLIDMLRKRQKEEEEFNGLTNHNGSLWFGIMSRRLNYSQLAECADIDEPDATCRTFLVNEPRCLDLFCARLKQREDCTTVSDFVKFIWPQLEGIGEYGVLNYQHKDECDPFFRAGKKRRH
jgi:hypothetical protein